MSASLRHLRAPALASWIAEALSDAATEEHSGVNLIAREHDDDGACPLPLRLRLVRYEAHACELRDLSAELEGDDLDCV